MNPRTSTLLALVGLYFCLHTAQAGLDSFLSSIDYDSEANPTEARNLRAEARYHWAQANKAQNQMLKAENDDDIDRYEEWLEKMREEDQKWQTAGTEYNQLRDMLEAKIRTGELSIEGFEGRYEKGKVESIFDHLLFKVKQ